MRVRVASQLAADGRRVATQPAGDGAHALAGLDRVGDLDALVLVQMLRRILRADVAGVRFHAPSVPVHQRSLVTPARPGAPVAPHLARALGHAHRVRGLRKVHPRL